MNKDIDKQEELVAALWDFAYDLETMRKDCFAIGLKNEHPTHMSMEAIHKAIERIMKNFDYEVIPVE